MKYLALQEEVKHRATRNQGGSQFTTSIQNAINAALFRISRDGKWRSLRRKSYFATKTSYDTGTGAASVTSAGTTVNVTGATFYTDGVEINRKVKISGDSTYHIVRQVTGQTSFVMDSAYAGTSHTTATYEIYPQEEYNLPVQCGHNAFLWHEEWGAPYQMNFMTDQDFYSAGAILTTKSIPTSYRMWGEGMYIKQVLTPSTLGVFSSVAGDTNIDVTIFGTSNNYPESETIKTNGTTTVSGSVTFSKIERVVKNGTSTGRISVSASGDTSLVYATVPIGNTMAGVQYKKVQLYPLPSTAFNINVYYYKDPARLVGDNDVHELGEAFDEAIILLAVSKIKGETEQAGTGTFYSLYQDEMRSLRKTNTDKIDWFPKMRRAYAGNSDSVMPGLRYSQAGAYYGRRS